MQINGDIIVGIDGSEASCEAAAWALKESRRSGQPLRLVSVAAAAHPKFADLTEARQAAEAALAHVGEKLTELMEGQETPAEFTTELHDGDPAEVMAELSEDAGLLVIGHHGSDQPPTGRIGTVSSGLPGHALSPVLIHRATRGSEFDSVDVHPRGEAGVVIGLDTSDYSGVAALNAAGYAGATNATLHIVVGTAPLDGDEKARAQTELDMTWLRSHFPGLRVDAAYHDADPVDLLIEQSKDADLLVMGKRGIGRFASMLAQLGRTTSQVMPRAECSLLVVPFRDDPKLDDRRLAD